MATPEQLVAQGAFDFLCPHKGELLRPDQVAQVLGRKCRHVYELIEEGKLEAHAIKDRQVKRYRITRRSVLAHLAETANYTGEEIARRTGEILATLPKDHLQLALAVASSRRK